jgi:hypothetical protein
VIEADFVDCPRLARNAGQFEPAHCPGRTAPEGQRGPPRFFDSASLLQGESITHSIPLFQRMISSKKSAPFLGTFL